MNDPGMWYIDPVYDSPRWRCGFKFQLGGLWVGAHWSKYNRRLCVNIIPCFTVWVCLPGGKVP